MTPLVYTMPRGTAQIDDISTWLPPSLHTPWQNVFFEYINNSQVLDIELIGIQGDDIDVLHSLTRNAKGITASCAVKWIKY